MKSCSACSSACSCCRPIVPAGRAGQAGGRTAGIRRPGAAEVIFLLAKEFKQTRFTVPDDFPAGVYDKLFELGLDLEIATGALFPAREIKTAAEIAAIREGNRAGLLQQDRG